MFSPDRLLFLFFLLFRLIFLLRFSVLLLLTWVLLLDFLLFLFSFTCGKYQNNFRMNKCRKRENSLYKFKRVHQLVFQYQIFNYENIHTNTIMHVQQVLPMYFGIYKTNTFIYYAYITINKNQGHYFKREQVQVYGKIWREERGIVNRRMMLFLVIIRHPSPGLCAVTPTPTSLL